MLNRFDYRKIRQLLLLAVVVEEKSFRRAAQRLSMSLPPLTAQIDELEERLGLKLLSRSPRGVEVTPEGRALLPEVKRMVEQAELLDYSVSRIRSGQRGLLTLGAVMEAMLAWVPDFQKRIAVTMPETAVFTKEIDSVEATTGLADNRFDLAVGYFREPDAPNLRRAVLSRERPVVLLPAGSPLASQPVLRLADLAREDWVLPAHDVSPDYVESLTAACRRAGFEPRIRHEVSSTMRQAAYVGCGQGLALVPAFFLCMLPPSVAGRELADTEPFIELCALWRTDLVSPVRDAALLAAGVTEAKDLRTTTM